MGNQIISFRLTPLEIALVEKEKMPDESISQTASRLVKERIGIKSKNSREEVTLTSIEKKIKEIVFIQLEQLNSDLKNLVEDEVKKEAQRFLETIEANEPPAHSSKKPKSRAKRTIA